MLCINFTNWSVAITLKDVSLVLLQARWHIIAALTLQNEGSSWSKRCNNSQGYFFINHFSQVTHYCFRVSQLSVAYNCKYWDVRVKPDKAGLKAWEIWATWGTWGTWGTCHHFYFAKYNELESIVGMLEICSKFLWLSVWT